MFSLAYVILPFSDIPPADAIRASLSRFQRGLRGDIPDEWLAFADETDALRQAHETRFTFTDKGKHGFQVEGGHAAFWHVDTDKIRIRYGTKCASAGKEAGPCGSRTSWI